MIQSGAEDRFIADQFMPCLAKYIFEYDHGCFEWISKRPSSNTPMVCSPNYMPKIVA